MMTDELAVRITVSGRLGPTLCTAFAPLGVHIVPRHSVILVGSEQASDLVALLEALEHYRVVVDRITSPGTVPPGLERPGHVRR